MTWKDYVETQALHIGWKVDGEKLFSWLILKCPTALDVEEVLSGKDIPEGVLYRAFKAIG